MSLVAAVALVTTGCGSPDTQETATSPATEVTAPVGAPGTTTAGTAPRNRQTTSSDNGAAPGITAAGRPPTGDEVLSALDKGRLPPGTAETVRAWAEDRCPTLDALTTQNREMLTARGVTSSSPAAAAAVLDEDDFRGFMDDLATAAEKFADAQLPMPPGFEVLEPVITDDARATVDWYRANADAWAVLRAAPNPPPRGTSPEWDRIQAAQQRQRGSMLPWLLAALVVEAGGNPGVVPEGCVLYVMAMGPYVMHQLDDER